MAKEKDPSTYDLLSPSEKLEFDLLLSLEKPTLAVYVSVIKHLTLDPWQRDLCNRLEERFWLAQADRFEFKDKGYFMQAPSGYLIAKETFNEHYGKGSRVAIHAAPQFGKSIIISQCYPAWILGYDPTHRFRLATYNVFHSARFSVVIKHIMASAAHRAFFPEPDTFIALKSKAVEWSTVGRIKVADGQASFTALGLQSGFTGTGADTLLMDDPYKSMEEALSEIIRDKTWRFHTDTASPRLNDQSNEYIMFHRYHQDDIGGRALASGEFELWRYAAEADGPYIDEQSGQSWPDPLNRPEGELLSPRFSQAYYDRQKSNDQVWQSQFQGRPVSKSGNMFNVAKIRELTELPKFVHEVRAWDNAATEGGGAYTAGVRMGITAMGRCVITNVKREQVDSARRTILQHTTADEDGLLVEIHAPQDPGSAGKDVAFQFEQELTKKRFNVTVNVVSGSKEMRAYPFSQAVNSGMVDAFIDGSWNFKAFKDELHNFPLSTYKDQVDAGSDAYSHLYRLFHRGLVVKNFLSLTNLVSWSRFARRFAVKIPGHWEVSGGLRIEGDKSKPSAWAITARAAENAMMGEVVFLVASRKFHNNDVNFILKDFAGALERYCEKGAAQTGICWLRKGNTEVQQLAQEKFNLTLHEFEGDEMEGIPETNWYFQFEPQMVHPFYQRVGASHFYLLTADDQIDIPVDDEGLLASRQDLATWAYNDDGKPQPFGGVTLDCVRMTLFNFALSATAMTDQERRVGKLPDELKPATVLGRLGKPDFVEQYTAQQYALNQIKIEEQRERDKQRKEMGKILQMPRRRQFGKRRAS